VFLIPTNEELMIARDTKGIVGWKQLNIMFFDVWDVILF
jgi:hypothetical protein